MLITRHVFIAVIFFLSCASAVTEDNAGVGKAPGSWLRNVPVEYEVDGNKYNGTVQIYFPRGYAPGTKTRTLIVLHGWRQTPGDWENNTPIAEHADVYGFVLVCPAMSVTLYESKYFPETALKWAPLPGGEYTAKVLIEFLRKNHGLALERERTGIFGISTGGRGALLLAAQHSALFGAAAGISGDYDSESLKYDRLLVSVYGPYERNRGRWEEEVNILKLAKNLKNTPVFLAHGTRDAIVPPLQTKMLVARLGELRKESEGYDLQHELEKSNNAGHDWKYWASLVPDVLQFFDQRLKK